MSTEATSSFQERFSKFSGMDVSDSQEIVSRKQSDGDLVTFLCTGLQNVVGFYQM